MPMHMGADCGVEMTPQSVAAGMAQAMDAAQQIGAMNAAAVDVRGPQAPDAPTTGGE